jgi:hypothetical protein
VCPQKQIRVRSLQYASAKVLCSVYLEEERKKEVVVEMMMIMMMIMIEMEEFVFLIYAENG